MTTSTIEATYACHTQRVWDTVTSLTDYAWRSDISRIEVLEAGKQFVEFTADGFPTTFTITAFEPTVRYEFDMDNRRMQGHWSGVFSQKDGQTTIRFTEEVTAKAFYLKPFVKAYLKKQQAAYIADLGRELAKQ